MTSTEELILTCVYSFVSTFRERSSVVSISSEQMSIVWRFPFVSSFIKLMAQPFRGVHRYMTDFWYDTCTLFAVIDPHRM